MRDFGTIFFGEGTLDGRFHVFFNDDTSTCQYRIEICLEEADSVVELDVTEQILLSNLYGTVSWLKDLLSGKTEKDFAGIGWGRIEFLVQDEKIPTVDLIVYLQEAEQYDGSGMYLRVELYRNILEELWTYLRKVCKIILNLKSEFDSEMIEQAKEFAARQYDYYCHMDADNPPGYLLRQMVLIEKDGYETMDPWVPQDATIPIIDIPYACHGDKESGFDPFRIYGKEKMDTFIREILEKNGVETAGCMRGERIKEIKDFYKVMGLSLPEKFLDEMSNEELKKMLESLDEFDPCGNL